MIEKMSLMDFHLNIKKAYSGIGLFDMFSFGNPIYPHFYLNIKNQKSKQKLVIEIKKAYFFDKNRLS